jgi:hypothetical protein
MSDNFALRRSDLASAVKAGNGVHHIPTHYAVEFEPTKDLSVLFGFSVSDAGRGGHEANGEEGS